MKHVQTKQMDMVTIMNMIMIILVVSSHYAAYDLKCPDRPHRKIRANWLCNSKVEDYSCLLDLQNGSFKESCSFTSDFVRPGQKYVFSGRRKNTNCSNERYQPFKFYSDELSMCALVKSLCREEGQLSFNDGSTKEERHCRCDYTRGYTFLSTQNHQCFCNPGEADCSCYIANCSTIGQLSTDYECKSGPLSTTICQPIVYTRPREDVNKFFVKKGMAQRYKRQHIRSLGSVRAIAIITVLIIIVDILIVMDFMNMSIVLRHKWNDFNCKQTDVDEDQSIADDFKCKTTDVDEDQIIVNDFNCKMTDVDEDQIIVDETDELKIATSFQSSISKSSTNSFTPDEKINIVRKMYESLEKILQMEEFDKDLQDELSAAYPKDAFIHVLNSAKRDLIKNDCGIIVTGETSAGKTTLINHFVGQKIFSTNNVAATATVCRIRHSQTLMLKAYTKDERILADIHFDNFTEMRSTIKKFTDISYMEKDIKDTVFYVDIYLPVKVLKGNTILIDTPGIGEKEGLDNILLGVLQHAVSFIFVVNARNAGGIHEDRILRIFKNILDNIENMPCFDPHEVFFLTNQWDIVENDDDDEANTEKSDNQENRTWKLILSKLRKGWPGVNEKKIYQTSIKQVVNGIENDYSRNFKRFEENLSETILKNQNKRVEFYLSFLQNFLRNANRGIAARVKLLDLSSEEHKQIMKNCLERIERLEVLSNKYKDELEDHKTVFLGDLTENLYEYLHSQSTEEDILFPTEDHSIDKVLNYEVEPVIKTRFYNAIEKWLASSVTQGKMEDANEKVQSALTEIQLEFENIEMNMIGFNPRSVLKEKTDEMGIFNLTGKIWNHIFFLKGYFSDISSMFHIFHFLVLGEAGRKTRAKTIYQNVLKGFPKEKLKDMFESFFGKQYSKTIAYIFESEVPSKVKSMKTTNERMLKKFISLRSKQESFIKLDTMMKNLNSEIQNYKKTQMI